MFPNVSEPEFLLMQPKHIRVLLTLVLKSLIYKGDSKKLAVVNNRMILKWQKV